MISHTLIYSVLKSNARRLNEDMAETSAERQKVSAEVSDLLARVAVISTTSDAEEQKLKAEELLNDVNKPGSFAFSKMQGMGLQSQLDALGTKFGPTNMASLPPFQSDAELVACKYCSLVVDDYLVTTILFNFVSFVLL